ncbi:hypothetical protein DSO57_1032275 [Entomophthora muscae]|uniref:Uncharacterized protein n=1 Tax=Entomophthora muscae TaxID=34485 RepID=A0ACC2TZW5_9FUNG|nr:hypothetical protein DSO57_1032275 [Entomophthora muscae]
MKPYVAALICPEANTSMPTLIAEAKRSEKRVNMEYAACNGNYSSNNNGRENSNGNKRQNINDSNSNSNCNNGNHSQSANRSRPKKEDTAKINNAKTAPHYESDPTYSDLKGLKTEEHGKEEGEQAEVPLFPPNLTKNCTKAQTLLLTSHMSVRIDNSPPLEPQAQEQGSNPEPGFPWAAGPMDCRTARLHFSGVEPPQADAEDDGPSSETDQAEEIIALSGVPITTPNGGAQATTISFMSLKSKPATN